jgi:hypothetical protein
VITSRRGELMHQIARSRVSFSVLLCVGFRGSVPVCKQSLARSFCPAGKPKISKEKLPLLAVCPGERETT